MSSKDKNLSLNTGDELRPIHNKKIAVITAEWNKEITSALRQACISELCHYGCAEEDIISISVPGAFELPGTAKMLLSNQSLDAIICIGCVIKGETKHDEYISNAVASGLMTLSLASNKIVVFGVLTPNSMDQALDRAGGKYGNKGIEAAHTAIKMLHVATDIKELEKRKIGF